MAKLLNTSATNFYLEEMIKATKDRLMIISPYLKFNDRVVELLEDKNRLKIDVRIVYGKSELQPREINWLKSLEYVRTSFCRNLHAKCYLNENMAIITSMNLYDFSQVNNNEMGVVINRSEDPAVYADAVEEAQRIIRISDEVRMSMEEIESSEATQTPAAQTEQTPNKAQPASPPQNAEKLSTSRMARKLNLSTQKFLDRLVAKGYLAPNGDGHDLTGAGQGIGGELKNSSRFGSYFVWPTNHDY